MKLVNLKPIDFKLTNFILCFYNLEENRFVITFAMN